MGLFDGVAEWKVKIRSKRSVAEECGRSFVCGNGVLVQGWWVEEESLVEGR